MDNMITLSELIKELQSLEKDFGSHSVLSIGTCAGVTKDMHSPFTVNLSAFNNTERNRLYIASDKRDINKSVAIKE